MVKEVTKQDFIFNQNNSVYTYYFGKNQGQGREKYFEIEILSDFKIGLLSNGFSKPTIKYWKGKYIITINNEVRIIDEKTKNLLNSYILMGPIYETIINNEMLYIFAEIDILVLDKNLKKIKKMELKDVLTDYNINNNVLNYTTMDGENYQQLIR